MKTSNKASESGNNKPNSSNKKKPPTRSPIKEDLDHIKDLDNLPKKVPSPK